MIRQSTCKLLVCCAAAYIPATSAMASRPDATLWTPVAEFHCNVSYKGNDPSALKAVEVLSKSNPDKYFQSYELVKTRSGKGVAAEAFHITADSIRKTITVSSASANGLLYGALSLYRPDACRDRDDSPSNPLRILNHWDNLDGTIERGYAGKSIWEWDRPLTDEHKALYEKYALANAMAGINGTVLNNVNASPHMLDQDKLKRVAEIADILRPYGIRVYLSVNFASPRAAGGLDTSDPADKGVRRWWKEKAKDIYRIIPDFGGFLVKANSEGQPGPCDYGRTHAEGANMLAKALKPYGGIVMWRAFVYSASDPDRAKQAYAEFMPLDGQFADNVMVQVKNGPIDFQPREPYSPLFAGMEKTPMIAELQITQEYLGHANHLAYLAPMWNEFFEEAPSDNVVGVAGVANIGDNENLTGHPLAQANWYAFGRIAWDPRMNTSEILGEWTAMTPWLDLGGDALASFTGMMESSREHVVDYMMPMGLHHLFAFGHHYGPEPWCEVKGSRPDWLPKYYHNADSRGIGFDRTKATGSDATSQYPAQTAMKLEDSSTCPEKYLLWFHHLDWNHSIATGETVWQALNRHYDSGVAGVDTMRSAWREIRKHVDPVIYADVDRRLLTQHKDAIWWRDACLEYFGSIANLKPERNSMHSLDEMMTISLGIDNYTCPTGQLLDSKR